MLRDLVQYADHGNRWSWRNRLTICFIIEADVATDYGEIEGRACVPHTVDCLGELLCAGEVVVLMLETNKADSVEVQAQDELLQMSRKIWSSVTDDTDCYHQFGPKRQKELQA